MNTAVWFLLCTSYLLVITKRRVPSHVFIYRRATAAPFFAPSQNGKDMLKSSIAEVVETKIYST